MMEKKSHILMFKKSEQMFDIFAEKLFMSCLNMTQHN